MHGHNYVAFIECEAIADLDSVGRVVDFSTIKERVGGWIDNVWDHGFIVFDEDDEVLKALSCMPRGSEKMFSMPANPTAENMAEYLFYISAEILKDKGIMVTAVHLQETENCTACYRGEDPFSPTMHDHAKQRAYLWR
jgi:6-pyruvoyltetrahydropterin/6-carboxytetrahydropterin synthase